MEPSSNDNAIKTEKMEVEPVPTVQANPNEPIQTETNENKEEIQETNVETKVDTTRKRKEPDTQLCIIGDFDGYNVGSKEAMYKARAQNSSKRERREQIVKVAITLHHEGVLKDRKEIRRTILCGAQSSGKSTLLNSLISATCGRPVVVAPSAAKQMTKNCLDIILCPHDGHTFELIASNIRLNTGNDKEVRDRLQRHYDSQQKIDLTPEAAAHLKIKADTNCRFVDVPGPVSDGQDWNAYFKPLLASDRGGQPVFIVTINLQGNRDIKADLVLKEIINRIKKGEWKNVSLLIVATHADDMLAWKNGTEEFLDSVTSFTNEYEASLQSLKFAVVQLGKVVVDNNGLKTVVYDPVELMALEKECLCSNALLNEARRKNGEKLFILGVDELKSYLAEALADSVIEDTAFLQGLESALEEQAKKTQTHLETLTRAKSYSDIASTIVSRFEKEVDLQLSKLECSKLLRKALREITEKFWQERFATEIIDPSINYSKHDDVQLNPSTLHGMISDKWRSIMEQILENLALRHEQLTQSILENLFERTVEYVKHYEEFPTVATKLRQVSTEFGQRELGKFYERVKTLIRDQMVIIEHQKEDDDEKLADAWPEGSVLLKQAKLGEEGQEPIARTVLRTLIPVFRCLLNNLMIARFRYEQDYCNHLKKTLGSLNDQIEELSDQRKQDLEKRVQDYNLARQYIREILVEKGSVPFSTQRRQQEPPARRQRVEEPPQQQQQTRTPWNILKYFNK